MGGMPGMGGMGGGMNINYKISVFLNLF